MHFTHEGLNVEAQKTSNNLVGEAKTDRYNCDDGLQIPKHILIQCPKYTIPRTKLREQLWDNRNNEMGYDKIVSNP